MTVNARKREGWFEDIRRSVKLYDDWFIQFAPETYRRSRKVSIERVKNTFRITNDIREITPEVLMRQPEILTILRMITAPPLARDRLIGLAKVSPTLIKSMEEKGKLPTRLKGGSSVPDQIDELTRTIRGLIDTEIFPWLQGTSPPTDRELDVATSVIADRASGANADPEIRNEQERQQLGKIRGYLLAHNYREIATTEVDNPKMMPPGTFTFRLNLEVGARESVTIPVDAVIMPHKARQRTMPILIEAKSAGDFTNTNKRRKEEATKVRQLKRKYGRGTKLYLFLRGYFGEGYLKYESREGLDWIWEHRIDDLSKIGI